MDILTHPFVVGLLIGLIIACIVWAKSILKNRSLLKRIEKLQTHLQTQLEIEGEAKEKRKQEMEELKKQNENLRVATKALGQKPGKAEIRQLHVYQRTLELMFERAPGFAQAWQATIREAEREMTEAEEGVRPMVKRVIGSPFSRQLPEQTEERRPSSSEADHSPRIQDESGPEGK